MTRCAISRKRLLWRNRRKSLNFLARLPFARGISLNSYQTTTPVLFYRRRTGVVLPRFIVYFRRDNVALDNIHSENDGWCVEK